MLVVPHSVYPNLERNFQMIGVNKLLISKLFHFNELQTMNFVVNITIFPFDYLNPSLITNKKKLLVELHRLLYIVNLLQQACPLSQIRSDHIKLCNRILHSQKTNFKTDIFMKMSSN